MWRANEGGGKDGGRKEKPQLLLNARHSVENMLYIFHLHAVYFTHTHTYTYMHAHNQFPWIKLLSQLTFIHVKNLKQCLALRKHSMNINYFFLSS